MLELGSINEMVPQVKESMSFAQEFKIWDSHPDLMNIQASNVEFLPSVHHVNDRIVHVVG